MTGFVTLAVGNERYYKLAANLLQSYRLNGNSDAPFAIFADRENKYTAMFDKVVLMDSPHLSYMDKLSMLNAPPYAHNIFIDADCLIYNDVSKLVENAQENGVRCFGQALDIQSTEGWFLADDVGEYKSEIKFIPQMHGGIIFFSDDELTRKIYNLALKISSEYSKYKFKYFERPADEPILALSMAVNNCPPIELKGAHTGRMFCFLPAARTIRMNIRDKCLAYEGNCGVTYEGVAVLHWQNHMTRKPIYYREIDRMTMSEFQVGFRFVLRWIWYHAETIVLRGLSWIKRHLKIS